VGELNGEQTADKYIPAKSFPTALYRLHGALNSQGDSHLASNTGNPLLHATGGILGFLRVDSPCMFKWAVLPLTLN